MVETISDELLWNVVDFMKRCGTFHHDVYSPCTCLCGTSVCPMKVVLVGWLSGLYIYSKVKVEDRKGRKVLRILVSVGWRLGHDVRLWVLLYISSVGTIRYRANRRRLKRPMFKSSNFMF